VGTGGGKAGGLSLLIAFSFFILSLDAGVGYKGYPYST